MTVAHRIRTLRAIRQMTQDELAQRTGIAKSSISLLESGAVFPNAEWEQKLRAALSWTPEIDAQLDALIQSA